MWVSRGPAGVTRWSRLDIAAPDKMFEALLHPPGQIDWAEPHVAIYSFPAATAPPVTLLNLGDAGQAHAIDYLAKNTKDEPHSWSDLQAALTGAGPASVRDPFKFERVLVATVTKGADWAPGDRMIWTRVFVQPINFEFGDYTIAPTQSATDKIASVEATKSRKLATDLTLTLPGAEGPKLDVAPSDENTVKTTQDINSQVELLGVDIERNFLRIIRESNPGGDVSGNSLVPLALVTDLAAIRKKSPGDADPPALDETPVLLVTGSNLTAGGKDLAEDKGADIEVVPQILLPHCPLKARVWMLYQQRHIVAQGEFYDESRQEVVLLNKADGPREVEIVPADDVSPAVWRIRIEPPAGTAKSPDGAFLAGRAGNNGELRTLAFTDYGRASALTHWLRLNYRSHLGAYQLNYTPGASLITVKVTSDTTACAADASPGPR